MRARLAVTLFVPLLLVLAVIGSAYVFSLGRAAQQAVYLDRLSDAGYLVVTARQSLTSDDPQLVAADLERYREVYGIRAAVLDQAGDVWASNGLDPTTIEERTAALAGRRSDLSTSLVPWRADQVVVAEPVFDGGDVVGAVLTQSDARELSRGIWLSWGMLAAAAVLVCLLAVLVAHRTAGWVLRPVGTVDRAMAAIGAGRLDARIPVSTGPPELRVVVARFNEMAARLEHLVRRQQDFVSNASHELRNPLNALMLRVEDLALSVDPRHADEVAHVRAEARRMGQILDALLLLADGAEADAGVRAIDVGELVSRRARSWHVLAPDRPVNLVVPEKQTWAFATGVAVECAVDAVLDNAMKYAPASTPLEVGVAGAGPHHVEIVVRDHGPGVPPGELGQLTERFWRSPGTRRVGGSGLGLAIASELLAGCDGDLRLELPAGGGLRARIRLPRSATPVRGTVEGDIKDDIERDIKDDIVGDAP